MYNIIFAHANCADGAAAAAAMFQHLIRRDASIPTSVYYCHYGDGKHENIDLTGADVYIVDFSFKRDVVCLMAAIANSVTILDHHKTAKEDLNNDDKWCPPNVDIVFDMERSGAMITWDWCRDREGQSWETPKLYQYVQDRDLWHFKLPHSKAISAFIANGPMTGQRFIALQQLLETDFDSCVKVGDAIYAYQLNTANSACQLSQRCVTQDGTPFVLANVTTVISETGHMLLEQNPWAAFSATYFDNYASNKRSVSLRGRDSDDFDVSAVAKKFGGGGHKKAAGLSLPLNAPVQI